MKYEVSQTVETILTVAELTPLGPSALCRVIFDKESSTFRLLKHESFKIESLPKHIIKKIDVWMERKSREYQLPDVWNHKCSYK
jgi:hypothetical protein